MLSHSKRESNNWSEDSLIHRKHSIFGLRFKNYGPVWNQSSQEVISLSKCHFKLNNSQVLTRLGWNACKNHLKPKRFFSAVSLIYWKTIYQICRRNSKNVKNYWKLIWKVRENCSQDSISCPTQLCWRSCPKVQNQLRFKKISKNCLMLSLRLNLVNQTRKDQTKRLFWLSFKKPVVHKRCHWQPQLDVKV